MEEKSIVEIEAQAAANWAERLREYGPGNCIRLNKEVDIKKATEGQWLFVTENLPRPLGIGRNEARLVLDFACGCGRFLPKLAQCFPKATVVGWDNCRANVETISNPGDAWTLFGSGWGVARAGIEEVIRQKRLKGLDFVFDCLSLGVMDLAQVEQYFKDLYGLLSPGGAVVLLEHMDRGDHRSNEHAFYRRRKIEAYNEMFAPLELREVGYVNEWAGLTMLFGVK